MLKEDTTQCAEEQKAHNILFTVSRNILPVTVCLPSSKHAPSTAVQMDSDVTVTNFRSSAVFPVSKRRSVMHNRH